MRTFMFAAGVAACSLAAVAHAKTFSFPHVLETSGRITGTPFTFDTTIFADYNPSFDSDEDGDPDNTYYTKKHIGNVKYEEISFSATASLELEVDISDITETFVAGEYRTTFAILFQGTYTDDNGVVTPVSSSSLSVFGFDPVPISAASFTSPYVVTLPGFSMFAQGTSNVVVEIDPGAQFTLLPTPGAAGFFGVAGLAAMRRRRA